MPDHLRAALVPSLASEGGGATGEGLSAEGARLLAALAPDAPKTVDALCAETGLPAHRVLALLLELKMAGACAELAGMRYALASARR